QPGAARRHLADLRARRRTRPQPQGRGLRVRAQHRRGSAARLRAHPGHLVLKHAALQRALVIALHDPSFVAAMHDDPEGVLAPLGLDDEARRALLAVDRRAFRTDPLRTLRVLRVLADELKVSSTLALWETRSTRVAMGFFSSPFFRAAVAARGAL